MKVKFDHSGALAFFGSVDCAKFQDMSRRFDDTKLQSLSSKYDRFFDLVRLVSDLIGLYSSQQMRSECKSPGQVLIFLARKDLIGTVPEETKLLHLVLIIPVMTVSVARSFSALKRIKTRSWNRTKDDFLPWQLSKLRERLLKLKEKEKKEDFFNKARSSSRRKGKWISITSRGEIYCQVPALHCSVNCVLSVLKCFILASYCVLL